MLVQKCLGKVKYLSISTGKKETSSNSERFISYWSPRIRVAKLVKQKLYISHSSSNSRNQTFALRARCARCYYYYRLNKLSSICWLVSISMGHIKKRKVYRSVGVRLGGANDKWGKITNEGKKKDHSNTFNSRLLKIELIHYHCHK